MVECVHLVSVERESPESGGLRSRDAPNQGQPHESQSMIVQSFRGLSGCFFSAERMYNWQ